MGVKSGMLLLSSLKPYQAMSWNEQGEVTKIEGILIIDFLLSFPCSHREHTKNINLILKLHYMIKMPYPYYDYIEMEKMKKQLVELQGWKNNIYKLLGESPFNQKKLPPEDVVERLIRFLEEKDRKINDLGQRIKNLENKFEQMEKEKDEKFDREIKKRDNEIYNLKEKLNMDPKWQKTGNSYWRWNPDLQKEEGPIVVPTTNFDVAKVEIIRYNKDKTIITYKYFDESILEPKKPLKMPRSLYIQLWKERRNNKNI